MATKHNIKVKKDIDAVKTSSETFSLIVWNDDVNTFDWVIEALVDICHHTHEQAEQCAMIIDQQGKYAVKHGVYKLLKPMCNAITERGINATVEAVYC